MKKIIVLINTFLLLALNTANAQTGGTDFMRNTGMIYVVVGVILIIFIGIIAFLMRLDSKLTKLENQIKENE